MQYHPQERIDSKSETGFSEDISPLAHISSTIAGLRVRSCSESAALAATRSRIPRANPKT